MPQYRINYHGCDGRDVTRFSSLADAAKYVKARDLGPEYRKPGGLQGEYAFFGFSGFSWEDILEGAFFDEQATYRAELINAPMKIRWKKAGISPQSMYDAVWYGTSGGEIVASIDLQKDGSYVPNAGYGCPRYLPSCATLKEAKDVILAALQSEVTNA